MDDKQCKAVIEIIMLKKLQKKSDTIENRIIWYNLKKIIIGRRLSGGNKR